MTPAEKQAKNIFWLEFELSNYCQYAEQHKWCPASKDDRPLIFLSSGIVRKVVDYFEPFDYDGRVFFSGYSEPLIDPRLIDLVKYTKSKLPKSHILMFSNGIAADEHLLKDVMAAGVEWIKLSVYGKKQHERLSKIARNIPGVMLINRSIGNRDDDIDNRINVYNEDTVGCGGKCFMPTLYYFVRNNGDVNMCFWDWRYTQIWGNLYTDSIEDTLLNADRLRVNSELVKGNRSVLPVCERCQLPDYRCTREYIHRIKL